jgi:uncharacterized cupin superfamily protein
MTEPSIVRLDPSVPLERWPDFPESEISSGTRASIGHRWLEDKANGFSVGVWEAEANLGRWMKWPVHEFMVAVEGEVVMVEEDRETVIGPGESFFIPKGRRCIWNQSGYFKKLMVIFNDVSAIPPDGKQPIIKIDPQVALTPTPPPASELLHSLVPVQQAHEYFKDATEQLRVGVWQTTSYHQKMVNAQGHELIHLLEGTVTITDSHNLAQSFGPGDTLLVPMGTPNSWKSEGVLRKVYCSFQPRRSNNPMKLA